MMKKPLFLPLLASAYLALPVGVASAQLDPGCSPDVMAIMQTQADAVRARNRAYAMEIFNRDNSTLYLTCFDRAVAFSTRLGLIFSDKIPAGPYPAADIVWEGDVEYPDWGARRHLAIDLNNSLTPQLDNYLENFYPEPPAENAITTLANTIQRIIDTDIIPFQEQEALDPYHDHPTRAGEADPPAELSVLHWNELMEYINNHVTNFPNIPWDQLAEAMSAYETGVGWVVGGGVPIAESRERILGPVFERIADAVRDADMDGCTQLDDVWNDPDNRAGDPFASPPNPARTHFYPVEGDYYALSPYFTLREIMDVGALTTPPATYAFLNELDNTTDSEVLADALADLDGPLSAPGPDNPVWPGATDLSAVTRVSDVIENMRQ